MTIQRKRVAKRLASGLLAGALALGGLAISGSSVSAKTPSSPTTKRLSGADRYDTAVAITRNQIPADNPKALVIASGESYADALAAASLTYSATNPDLTAILLVKKDSIPASVADYLSDIKSGFASLTSPSVFIVGGTSVISTEVENAVKSALAVTGDLAPAVISRKDGANRYETAKKIGDTTGLTTYNDTMILVGGDSWADALIAGSLASEKGWPIALVPAGGITADASTQAMVDNYLKLTSSVKQFVIFGGPAAVPSSVEQYLASTKSVPPANIRRIAGADRYQTNLFANLYLANGVTGEFFTVEVALASGQAPWDAIAASAWAAAKGAHILLTPTAGGSANAATLAATLSGLASLGVNPSAHNNLWVLGGKAAVSDAARAGYIAAAANDLTSSLSGCDASRTGFTLTLSGGLTSAEGVAAASHSAMMDLITINGVKVTAANGGISELNTPGTPRRTIYSVTVSTANKLAATQTIKFAGWTEATAVGTYTPTRSIASATCVVGADTLRPTTDGTPLAWAGSLGAASTTSAGAHMYIKFSEPVTLGDGVSVSAGSVRRLIAASAANVSTSGSTSPVTKLDSSGKEWLVEFDPADTGIGATGAGDVLELAASAIKDQAGNTPAVPVQATAAADSSALTAPKASVIAVRCVATPSGDSTVNATVTSGVAIKIETDSGAKGNSWTMTVTNVRGTIIPTVTVDSTAKTIAIVADTKYHTSGDIATVMANNMQTDAIVGDFTVTSAAATALSATLLGPVKATGGTSDCQLVLTADEPFTAGGNFSVTIANTPQTSGKAINLDEDFTSTGDIGNVLDTVRVVLITTSTLGAGSLLFADADDGLSDIKGNNTTTAIGFTAG